MRIRASLIAVVLVAIVSTALVALGVLSPFLAAGPAVATQRAAETDLAFELSLPSSPRQRFSTAFTLDGRTRTLDLELHSLRAPDMHLLIAGHDGYRAAGAPALTTYRGRVREDPGSRVAASLAPDGGLVAVIDDPDADEPMLIRPVLDAAGRMSPTKHVLESAAAMFTQVEGFCSVPHEVEPRHDHAPTSEGEAPALARSRGAPDELTICEIAFDTDVEFFEANGSRFERVTSDVEMLMNAISLIYERDLGITFELTVLVIRPQEPDPYGPTERRLVQVFREVWNSDPQLVGIRRQNAHLLMGRFAGIIGVADQIGAIFCESSPPRKDYALSFSLPTQQISQRINITAHEIGHLWNAAHCNSPCPDDCGIMRDFAAGGLFFGACSRDSIARWLERRVSCAERRPTALDPPFFDGFEPDRPLDRSLWVFADGAEVTNGAVREPSGNGSLELDARFPNPWRFSQARTNVLRLGGGGIGQPATDALVSYWVRPLTHGFEGALVVEGKARGGRWIEMNRIQTGGPSQREPFRFHANVIPNVYRHDEFQLRFRHASGAPALPSPEDSKTRPGNPRQPDDGRPSIPSSWFIDDVVVAESKATVELTLRTDGTPDRTGAICFDVKITNRTNAPESVDLWIDVIDPDGFPVTGSRPALPTDRRLIGPRGNVVLTKSFTFPPGVRPRDGTLVRAHVGRYFRPSPVCPPEQCLSRPWWVAELRIER